LWEYNDNWEEPGAEGGETVRAFRRREDAEALRDLLEEEARQARGADAGEDSPWRFEMDRWRRGAFDPPKPDPLRYDVVPAGEATFYEVIEIELGPGVGEKRS
jgi:hypothetical protein